MCFYNIFIVSILIKYMHKYNMRMLFIIKILFLKNLILRSIILFERLIRLFSRENSEIRYYNTIIFSRKKQYYALRQPKLLCLLSLLLRTFNSLKSAGEQSTEYNSLRLIYFVRFILFAWIFFSLDFALRLARSNIAKKIVSLENSARKASNNLFISFRILKYIFLYINVVNYKRLHLFLSHPYANISRKY